MKRFLLLFLTMTSAIVFGAGSKTSDLTTLSAGAWSTSDQIPIVDVSAGETKKTTIGDFDLRYLGILGTISLSSQTSGTLAIAKGGTARTSAVSAGNFLYYNGSAYVDGTIAAGTGTTITNVGGVFTISGASTLAFISPLLQNGTSVSIQLASGSSSGYLSSTDWTNFNNKLSSVAASSPILSNGSSVSLGTVGIANGGSGQITANAALNAFLPLQTGFSTAYLKTDGTNTSWGTVSSGAGSVTSVWGTNGIDANPNPVTGVGTLTINASKINTGTLAIAQGGTGLSAIVAAGNFLTNVGGVYSAGTIAAGAGISFTNVAGVMTVTNNGANALAVLATTGTTYSASTSEDIILTTGSLSVNLYATSGNRGKKIIIKKTDSTNTNIVTIDPNASETIDGDTTKTIRHQYESLTLVTDGTNWHALTRDRPPLTLSYVDFTNTGSCAVSNDPEGMVSTVGDPGAGLCGVTMTTNFWAATPKCWCNAGVSPLVTAWECTAQFGTATLGTTYTSTANGTDSDRAFTLYCLGLRKTL